MEPVTLTANASYGTGALCAAKDLGLEGAELVFIPLFQTGVLKVALVVELLIKVQGLALPKLVQDSPCLHFTG